LAELTPGKTQTARIHYGDGLSKKTGSIHTPHLRALRWPGYPDEIISSGPVVVRRRIAPGLLFSDQYAVLGECRLILQQVTNFLTQELFHMQHVFSFF
jgi:hypothetical protein